MRRELRKKKMTMGFRFIEIIRTALEKKTEILFELVPIPK